MPIEVYVKSNWPIIVIYLMGGQKKLHLPMNFVLLYAPTRRCLSNPILDFYLLFIFGHDDTFVMFKESHCFPNATIVSPMCGGVVCPVCRLPCEHYL